MNYRDARDRYFCRQIKGNHDIIAAMVPVGGNTNHITLVNKDCRTKERTSNFNPDFSLT